VIVKFDQPYLFDQDKEVFLWLARESFIALLMHLHIKLPLSQSKLETSFNWITIASEDRLKSPIWIYEHSQIERKREREWMSWNDVFLLFYILPSYPRVFSRMLYFLLFSSWIWSQKRIIVSDYFCFLCLIWK